MITDQQQRQDAIDISQSFIIQAPAGSGKTELLTQRFLALLGDACEKPEEIIAITFTKKAASEMRERIHSALIKAAISPLPEQQHAQQTYYLAKSVLERNKNNNWDLLDNPNRLQIQTIDSLCASLAAKMPILSQLGALPPISDNPTQLYQLAAQSCMDEIEDNQPWQESLEILYLHCDTNLDRIERLFIEMLQCRDQWLPLIMKNNSEINLKNILEKNLQHIIVESLCELNNEFTPNHKTQLVNLIDKLKKFPEPTISDFKDWQLLINILFTQSGTYRKSLNKNHGFPPGSMAKKDMMVLLADLQEGTELAKKVVNFNNLPQATYSDNQWKINQALLTILPILSAHLMVVFQEQNQIDFIEIALRALQALGPEENPTDLALILDYQIKHLLIDEFQDTSVTQFHLLQSLTRGWEPHDGRSLFLVGDPMQSIYRFRQADVGLFLRAKEFGVGNIRLNSLVLKSNFRSDKILVDYFNQTFNTIFPTQSNITNGAIDYSNAHSVLENTNQSITQFHANTEQSTQIISIIQSQPENNSIAILVRSRSHLHTIIHQLQHNKLNYIAIDIDPLLSKTHCMDILILTRALYDLNDRLSWLSLLRSPFCGLNLKELYNFTDCDNTIWQSILNINIKNKNLHYFIKILTPIISNIHRVSFTDSLYSAWIALGGPLLLSNQMDLEDCETLFDFIRQEEQANDLKNLDNLENKLEKLYSNPSSDAPNPIQLLTIHKSKGLEFDCVILPYLEKQSRVDTQKLLTIQERQSPSGHTEIIMGAIPSLDNKDNPLNNYLKFHEKQKAYYENMRLLYVACTRAKQQLHLLGNANFKDGEAVKPNSSTLLSYLWPMISDRFDEAISETENNFENSEKYLHKFKSNQLDYLNTQLNLPDNINFTQKLNPIEIFHWSIEPEAILGTYIHRLLDQWSIEIPNKFTPELYITGLIQLGYPASLIPEGLNKIKLILNNIKTYETPQWILNQPNARNELELIENNKKYILDRFFIENKTQWIIDYKTGHMDDKYKIQLNHYAKLIYELNPLPIKLGLYFPLDNNWITWEYEPNEITQ